MFGSKRNGEIDRAKIPQVSTICLMSKQTLFIKKTLAPRKTSHKIKKNTRWHKLSSDPKMSYYTLTIDQCIKMILGGGSSYIFTFSHVF